MMDEEDYRITARGALVAPTNLHTNRQKSAHDMHVEAPLCSLVAISFQFMLSLDDTCPVSTVKIKRIKIFPVPRHYKGHRTTSSLLVSLALLLFALAGSLGFQSNCNPIPNP